jgi:Oxidoreductase molybdopterin binding domain
MFPRGGTKVADNRPCGLETACSRRCHPGLWEPPIPSSRGTACSCPRSSSSPFRNRGMPLEAMRQDLTPTGLHYLVAHWDIPPAEPESWRLTVGGRVRRPLELTLEEIRARPRRTFPVTLECAGNGRGWLTPRPVSVPWLGEAIGTAEWTGTPLRALLEDAGVAAGAVEVVFRAVDRGIQGEQEQSYARSLALSEATRPEVLLACEMNGRASSLSTASRFASSSRAGTA